MRKKLKDTLKELDYLLLIGFIILSLGSMLIPQLIKCSNYPGCKYPIAIDPGTQFLMDKMEAYGILFGMVFGVFLYWAYEKLKKLRWFS